MFSRRTAARWPSATTPIPSCAGARPVCSLWDRRSTSRAPARSKIAITLRDPSLLPQMRMTLRQTDYLDDAVFVGLGLVEAARIASANPDLHIMGEMPAVPDNIAALVNASQTTGLFGLRAARLILRRLCSAPAAPQGCLP